MAVILFVLWLTAQSGGCTPLQPGCTIIFKGLNLQSEFIIKRHSWWRVLAALQDQCGKGCYPFKDIRSEALWHLLLRVNNLPVGVEICLGLCKMSRIRPGLVQLRARGMNTVRFDSWSGERPMSFNARWKNGNTETK